MSDFLNPITGDPRDTSVDVGRLTACVHRRLLESPNGPTVRAVCRLCGDVAILPSAAPDDAELVTRSGRRHGTALRTMPGRNKVNQR